MLVTLYILRAALHDTTQPASAYEDKQLDLVNHLSAPTKEIFAFLLSCMARCSGVTTTPFIR